MREHSRYEAACTAAPVIQGQVKEATHLRFTASGRLFLHLHAGLHELCERCLWQTDLWLSSRQVLDQAGGGSLHAPLNLPHTRGGDLPLQYHCHICTPSQGPWSQGRQRQ